MIDCKLVQTKPVTVISLQGRFDSSGSLVVEQQLGEIETLFLVIDLSGVNFLSSAGIRVLVKTEKSLRAKNGKVIFSSAPNSIKQVLQITGLLNQFTLTESNAEAVELAVRLQESTVGQYTRNFGSSSFNVKKYNGEACVGEIWIPGFEDRDNLIAVNLKEFRFAIGYGGFGTKRDDIKESSGKILLTQKFIGMLSENGDSDYLLTKNPSDTFFYVSSAVSFSGSPSVLIKSDNQNIAVGTLLKNSFSIISDMASEPVKTAGFIFIADVPDGGGKAIFSIGLMYDKLTGKLPEGINVKDFADVDETLSYNCLGITLKTDAVSVLSEDVVFSTNEIICEDSICGIVKPSAGEYISSARLWIFLPEFRNAQQSRLKINPEQAVKLSDEFEIITRNIYSDCSSITLQQLHGGFSAKTFQVFGYDKRGIRILPTVLKLAKRSTINREVSNYEDNVKRYILNNSTSIMGSFFIGDYGGVRYNFVGITGPDSRIGWLTNIYKQKPAEELIPLFDRIFTDILRPWYGQPKLENFYAYKEHNPTFTFFSELFEQCEEQLGISPDSEKVYFEELGREIINPYWFLKYGFKKREKESKLWYKCICHGDLNMQNILLDEVGNIYIIDYSETSLRNATADFARLEPIFKFEFPVINSEELKHLIKFEEGLLEVSKLDDRPQFTYTGNDPFIEKAYKMICRLREYAGIVTLFENDLIPYLLAVLEWTYSVVCYQSVDKMTKKYSAISAALICEKILKLENKS